MKDRIDRLRRSRWGSLAVWLLAVGGVFFLLRWHGSSTMEDRWLLAFIGGVYFCCIGATVWGTRRWTARTLGLLGTFAADFFLYAGTAASQFGWTVPALNQRLDLIRALFIVGGVCMLAGLIGWARAAREGDADGLGGGR